MTPEGNIVAVNSAFTKAFGYTREELADKNFAVLFTKKDQQLQRPQHELQKALSTGQADDKNYLVKKGGEAVWVSGETVLVANAASEKCLLKVVQDISTQKQAEHIIRNANDFNESILTAIDDIVIVLDTDMKIIKTNPAFHLLFNLKMPENAATDFISYISPHDTSGKLADSLRRVVQFDENIVDLQLQISLPADERIFSINARQMYLAQNDTGVLLVLHDITYQKQSERAREDIIGFVAHELRNPLSNVILCNEMLKHYISMNELEQADGMLQRSQHNIFRLNKMISELYEATKISSGNIPLEITSFDFDAMVREAIDTVQVLQPAFNIVVHGTGGMAAGDRYRLIQVVTNYLSNGIKYSNGHTDVNIYISSENNMLTVAVKDEGLGIAATQLPHLFDRFFRAEKTKNLEGIGLGLYLCRRIIDAHHGRVWAESTEGNGSIFYFSIPSNLDGKPGN